MRGTGLARETWAARDGSGLGRAGLWLGAEAPFSFFVDEGTGWLFPPAQAPLGRGTESEARRRFESSSSPRKCSSSLPAMADFMKVIQMGSAALAPVSFS